MDSIVAEIKVQVTPDDTAGIRHRRSDINFPCRYDKADVATVDGIVGEIHAQVKSGSSTNIKNYVYQMYTQILSGGETTLNSCINTLKAQVDDATTFGTLKIM